MKPQLKNYKKFFTTYAEITCLHTEFLLNGALKKNDLFATYKDGVYNIFLNREKENICFNESLELFKDDISYKKHFNEFKYYLDSAIKTVVQKYKIIPKNISKEELKQDLIFIGQFWKLYGTTESPYLDKAYEYMKQTRDEIMKQNLYNWAEFKFKARKLLNKYFFKGGVIDNLLELISRKFNVDARFMYSNEILNLFDGIKPDIVIINKRKISYSVAMLDEKLTIFSYKKSLELNDFFTSILPKNLIKGVAANKGIVKGSAIICPMLNDSKEILKINKLMKKGDILIAETTSPDIIILCNKAAAIVTEQGGMLSHAVIISREMNIPCVIQATNSTKIFKNGDLVEVNADKGIVRKLN